MDHQVLARSQHCSVVLLSCGTLVRKHFHCSQANFLQELHIHLLLVKAAPASFPAVIDKDIERKEMLLEY